MAVEPFERLGLALAIGFLIGIERGWRARDVTEGGRAAGLRTYALSGLLGGVAGMLSQTLGGWAMSTLGLSFATAFILFKQREQRDDNDYSATAVVAGLLTFGLGALAVLGDERVAAAAAVAVAALLAGKEVLHTWLKRLTWPELRDALVLLAMTFVALPLLPNRPFGPYGLVNFAELWVLTIAMAAISFVAYAAIKVWGPARGALLASAAGALISSTAVTFYLARLQKEVSKPLALAGAALVAGAIMAVRLGAITLALWPPLFWSLSAPLGVFAALSTVLGLGATVFASSGDASSSPSPAKSPFELALVLKFALVLGVIMAASRVAAGLYGPSGLLPVAALGGLVDADAVTLAAARMTAGGMAIGVAGQAVLLAAVVDSFSKMVIACVVGGWRFGGLYSTGTLLALGAAAGVWRWA
ncbi:DUF4010 domain-containing protein [Caulobacter sp. UNC279MFTsu5.1]|uniref:MgtC/SapB family protein n=1 Tax=Caulobacter sp. UNC279MFTsu5.1 TaxID=1502775 RepID=UPI0008EAE237|nr:DUF4010 domain-containing protein [Caulobacter sp. UNC279MFTsu5.1]SFK03744.1 Uncharacterized membrane protein, DUF4010 family [Caulobacter sp. UNC279MFTsu5.1]